MAGAFVNEPAAVLAQVTLQLAPLHAAIVSCSGSLSDGGASGSGVSIRRSASITLARASSRVRPWLNAPGTSGIDAMIQPSSPGSKRIVSCNASLTC